MKHIKAYLNFNGNCREAMAFYQQAFGGELQVLGGNVPGMDCGGDWGDRVMHAKLILDGNILLMASDCPPSMKVNNGDNVWLNWYCETAEEVDRLAAALGQGGKTSMPVAETFFARRFGMVTDRFGTNWMLLHGEKQVEGTPQATTAGAK